MNEEKSVLNSEKPRKKRRSLWWLWFLLILAAFAGGTVMGLKLNTLPLPTEVRDRLYPVLESYIPGSTTPRTPNAVEVTPEPATEPVSEPEPVAEAETTQSVEPARTPLPDESAVSVPEENAAPEQTIAPLETEMPTAPAASEPTALSNSAEPEKKYIGVGAALEIALTHAKIQEADAEISGVYRTKNEDGEAVYEVSFQSGDLSYLYLIDAVDGEVAGWKMSGLSFSDTATFAADFIGNDLPETDVISEPEPVSGQNLIGEENAKEIAFNHAAVKAAEVLRTAVELQHGEGTDYYSVEFKTATRRFTYTVDAYTGEILSDEVTK